MIPECPSCERPFESIQSAAMHAYKATNETHQHLDDLDDALLAVVDHNRDDGNAPSEPSGESLEPVGVPDSPERSSTAPDGPSTTAPDGPSPSRRSPPSFDGRDAPDPPETSPDADVADDVVDDDPLVCPSCGADAELDPSDVQPGARYECHDCGEHFAGGELIA